MTNLIVTHGAVALDSFQIAFFHVFMSCLFFIGLPFHNRRCGTRPYMATVTLYFHDTTASVMTEFSSLRDLEKPMKKAHTGVDIFGAFSEVS